MSLLTLKELKGYLAQRQYRKTDEDQHAGRTAQVGVLGDIIEGFVHIWIAHHVGIPELPDCKVFPDPFDRGAVAIGEKRPAVWFFLDSRLSQEG